MKNKRSRPIIYDIFGGVLWATIFLLMIAIAIVIVSLTIKFLGWIF